MIDGVLQYQSYFRIKRFFYHRELAFRHVKGSSFSVFMKAENGERDVLCCISVSEGTTAVFPIEHS